MDGPVAGTGVPLWLVALLLTETAVDAAVARPSLTVLLLIVHLATMRLARILL